MTVVERLLAAAALAVAGDPFVELGDLVGVALGERCRRQPRCAPAVRRPGASPSHRCRRSGGAHRQRPAGVRRGRGRRPARGLARRCRPPAAAASSAACASTPSSRRRSAMASTSIARNSIRAHRDEIVTRSCGTKSARITNVVDGGGSSIVFSISAAPSGRRRWNSSRIITLRSPSIGASDAVRTISRAWSDEIEAPTRATSWTSGCSPRNTRSAVRWCGVGAAEQQRRESAGGLLLGRPGRADEEVGVHRCDGRPREPFDGDLLADDCVPHRGRRAAHSPSRSRTADLIAAATSSFDRDGIDRRPTGRDRRPPSRRTRGRRGRGSRRRPARTGRAGACAAARP